MLRTAIALTLLALAPSLRHFDVLATFEPAKKPGGEGAVAVTFQALDPDVHVNETPAPQLRLDITQAVLEDRQPKSKAPADASYDPATAKYLDLQKPVRFPVAIAKSASRGAHEVKASVVFFYCSSREAWCRRGSVDVVIPVDVR
jgi:hypothetical protein